MSLDELSRAHDALNRDVANLYANRAKLILQARADGHGWKEIAATLGMTQHGAIKASKMGS